MSQEHTVAGGCNWNQKMASLILIVASMLVAAKAAPPIALTVDTCGVSRPCNTNDSFLALCPASLTCNEYLDCDHGIVAIRKCDKPFYMFWMTPVFTPSGEKCCTLVFKWPPVRPEKSGLCHVPDQADEDTGPVKPHTTAPAGHSHEHPQENKKTEQTPEAPTTIEVEAGKVFNTLKKRDTQQSGVPPETNPSQSDEKPADGEEKTDNENDQESASPAEPTSSGTVPSTSFLVIGVALILNLSFRH